MTHTGKSFSAKGARRAGLALAAAAMVHAGGVHAALDYQIHGFATAGALYSDGNNLYGDSTHGNFEFYEAGLNGTAHLWQSVSLSAQGFVRKAGATDEGALELDYALVDYRVTNRSALTSGLRFGRVKNAFGFYNETRDDVFTRPGIVMPDSIYRDSLGQRDLLFTFDGAQVYGASTWGAHELSATATYGYDRHIPEDVGTKVLTLPGDYRLEKTWSAELLDEIDGGHWRFGLSAIAYTLKVSNDPAAGPSGQLATKTYVASAAYNAEKFTLTGEYGLIPYRFFLEFGGTPISMVDTMGDGGYLQGDYRFTDHWKGMLRYDLSFRDRNDRNGRRYAASTPGSDPQSYYSRDATAGLNWQWDAHWGVWTEYHWINGTAAVPAGDNTGRTLVSPWSVALLMAGYRF